MSIKYLKLNTSVVKYIILLAFIITIATIILFSITFPRPRIIEELDTDKFNHFGAFMAGSVGILLSFAGTILIYISLSHQRTDIKQNREALSIQIEELKNQKIELELTRKIFEEQSKTAKRQRFETTFFNLVDLMNNNKEKIIYSPNDTPFTLSISKYGTGSEALEAYSKSAQMQYVKITVDNYESFQNSLNKINLWNKILQTEFYIITSTFYKTVEAILFLIQRNKDIPSVYYVDILKAQLRHIDFVSITYHLLYNGEFELFNQYGFLDRLIEKNFPDVIIWEYFNSLKQGHISGSTLVD